MLEMPLVARQHDHFLKFAMDKNLQGPKMKT